MLIDLFKNKKISGESNKGVGQLRVRKCDILEDLSYYNDEIAASVDQQHHITSVLENKDRERDYLELFGKLSDSHIEIEKLGVCRYARPYTTVVSLEDSLDYIFHRLCKSRIDNVRNIMGYHDLSRSLFKLNYSGLVGFSVSSLFGVDERLDEFIIGLLKNVPEEREDKNKEVILELMKRLLFEVSNITEYVSFTYHSSLDKGSAIIRSKSFCSFVLSSDKKLEDEIIIKSDGFEDYKIKVQTFEKKEYLHECDTKYV